MEEVEFDTNDLIKELQEYAGGGERKPGGVTVWEWADAQNVSFANATNQLSQLFRDGILTRRKYRTNGSRMVFVYYKASA